MEIGEGRYGWARRNKTRRAAVQRHDEWRSAVSVFDIAAVLIAVAAVSGYVNHRLLHLPPTSGTLLVALVSSIIVLVLEHVVPSIQLQAEIRRFLGQIDFNQTLMHGLLCFLLFAGALHVDLGGLLDYRWTIAALSTVGVVLSVLIVGTLTWLVLDILGLPERLLVCLTFGALISPTDPVAVMGLLKELRAPRSLEAQIAGESLFNDGVGVVPPSGLLSAVHMARVPASTRNCVRLANVARSLTAISLRCCRGRGSKHHNHTHARTRRFDDLVSRRDLIKWELLDDRHSLHPERSASLVARAAFSLSAGAKSSLPRKSMRMFLKSSSQNGMAGVSTLVA